MEVNKFLKKKCEICNKDFDILLVTRKSSKRFGLPRKDQGMRFCSQQCQFKWQKEIGWENKIGSKKAEEIRKKRSENNKGENNPMYGKKRDDLSDRNKSNTGKKLTKEHKEKISKSLVEQWKNGTRVNLKKINISQAERDIKSYLEENEIKVIHQYRVKGLTYVYDLFLPEYNLIIEYNGDYWHCNPVKYESTQVVLFPGKRYLMAKDVWEKDYKKELDAKNEGYNIEIVWEDDFKKNGLKVIDKILMKYEK